MKPFAVTGVEQRDSYVVHRVARPRDYRPLSRLGRSVRFLVLHYTASPLESTLNHFTVPAAGANTTAHYVVAQHEKDSHFTPGTIFSVVPESERASHAGGGRWKDVRLMNSSSIGIECVNAGLRVVRGAPSWQPFDEAQIQALGVLCQDIVARYGLRPQDIVGHADIVPHNKIDPGIRFPWGRLYWEYGVGAWLERLDPAYLATTYAPDEPLPDGIDVSFVLKNLKRYGYPVNDTTKMDRRNRSIIRAFKAHFSANQQPERYDDRITRAEMVWSWGLVAKYCATS